MRAVVIHEGDLHLEDRPDPVPGPGDVVVAVAAAGLNAADLLQRRGLYPAPAGWPADIPGMEFSGVVAALGEGVDQVRVGDRVCGLVGGGAQATHCVVPAEHLLAVPAHVDLVTAGGFAEAFLTAHDAVVTQGSLHPHERLLVSGAAGGVGTAALQIGRLRHAHVIAVARDLTHRDQLLAVGADEVVTVDQVSALAPVDVVLELIGAAHLTEAQRVLAPHARVVVIGVAGGGGRVELELLQFMSRRATLTGSTMRARTRQEKAIVTSRAAHDLLGAWAAGQLTVPIWSRHPLRDATAAYDAFAARGKFGKILLTTS